MAPFGPAPNSGPLPSPSASEKPRRARHLRLRTSNFAKSNSGGNNNNGGSSNHNHEHDQDQNNSNNNSKNGKNSHAGQDKRNNDNNNGSDDRTDTSSLHALRQSHNSSKLPAFRFADLKNFKRDSLTVPALLRRLPPSPVSPPPANSSHDSRDGPQSGAKTHDPSPQDTPNRQQTSPSPTQNPQNPPPNPNTTTKTLPTPISPSSNHFPPSTTSRSAESSPSRIRASTFQATSSSSATFNPIPNWKRPASFPDSPIVKLNGTKLLSAPPSPVTSTTVVAPQQRHNPAPFPAADATDSASPVTAAPTATTECDDGPQPGASKSSTAEPTHASPTADSSKGGSPRELLLPKSVEPVKADEKKKSRPPLSFRSPSISVPAGRAVIPPIRSFRSSGSRKSLVLDMQSRRTSYDSGEESSDPNHRDRTLRALEGRFDDDFSQITPPDSAEAGPEHEHTSDIFMRIAREDPARRVANAAGPTEDRSVIARIPRSTHTRPLSAAIPSSSYHISSPPQIARRLSDQRENSRKRRIAEDQSARHIPRELGYREIIKDQAASLPQSGEDSNRGGKLTRSSSLRPSPLTPRTLTFQEPSFENNPAYALRRPSLTDSNSGLLSRAPQYRSANLMYGQGRAYNSSPLVPRASDQPRHDGQHASETGHGVEGTESSASTAAPSTVWDELDELKSRIHRLELTGKTPSTSGAAMSRISDERPATATTNATTMSASPKRSSATNRPQPDATSSTTSSQRESQPILRSALGKTRSMVSTDVYSAIESAASEAMALSAIIGTAGQPGPISSGASTIGAGGSVTDRQLRRKAESICRSLTELCLALTDASSPQLKPPQNDPAPEEDETVLSPTTTTAKSRALASQRRPSAPEQALTRGGDSSPRAGTSMEPRRTATLLSTAMAPSHRHAAGSSGTPAGTPTDTGRKFSFMPARTRRAVTEEPEETGRRSSLLLGRNRRAGTEEPEEPASGRKSSLLLRSRRAVTEEPDEGRRTSLLLQPRRGVNEDDGEENSSRFRAPSRAATDVNSFRTAPREQHPSQSSNQDSNNPLSSSALPRRRFAAPTTSSRLAAPSTVSAAPTGRRYADRQTSEREASSSGNNSNSNQNNSQEKPQDGGLRQLSLSQTAMLNRTSSLGRRRRDSAIPSLTSPSTQAGSYR